MNFMGIDQLEQYSHMTLMDKEGGVLRSDRVFNSREEIRRFLEGLDGGGIMHKSICRACEEGFGVLDQNVFDDVFLDLLGRIELHRSPHNPPDRPAFD